MKSKVWVCSAMAWCLLAFSTPASAQRFEVGPYFGGFFPGQYVVADFDNSNELGVRFGGFVSEDFMIEGNIGRVHRVRLSGSTEPIRGLIWEGSGAYHFPTFLDKVVPYVNFGIGGMSMMIDGDDPIVFASVTRAIGVGDDLISEVRAMTLEGGNTFFTFSYGGGFKAFRLWGPFGLRASLGGRTMPSFLEERVSAFELTGGFNVAWGER